MATQSRQKNWLLNLGLIGFTFFVCFLIAEIGVRFLYKDDMVLFPRYHTDAAYGQFTIRRLRPNITFNHTSVDGSWEFTTNSQGFRDKQDWSYEKKPGVIRILVLGDSHTQGFEVRQEFTYSKVLERFLLKHGVKAEVLNAGVSGFSTAEELVFLEQEGIRYKPDYVVVGFFKNDFEDNIKADLFRIKDDKLIVNKHQHVPGVSIQNFIYSLPMIKWLGENSYFYSLLFNTVWEAAKKRLAKKNTAALSTEYAIPVTDASDYQLQLGAKLIERMRNFCDDNDIVFIVIDIPYIDSRPKDLLRSQGLVLETAATISSSIPHELKDHFVKNTNALLTSEEVLSEYYGLVNVFQPHGQRHITELAHAQYAMALGNRILSLNSDTK